MTVLSVRLLVLVGLLVLVATALLDPSAADAKSGRVAVLMQIETARDETWRWQRLMGQTPTRSARSERGPTSAAYRLWLRNLWERRAALAELRATKPPHRSAWLCIQRYERHPAQGWATNTGNGYYGGLQMSLEFQRAFGAELLRRKGTANRWSPLEQMWAAERAYRRGQGFSPWPNTARSCNVL